jgi:cell division protein FtsB
MFTILRQLGYLAAVAIACVYAFVVLRGPNGIPLVLEKKQQIHEKEKAVKELEQEVNRYQGEIDRLENDQEARDAKVRQDTGKQRAGETTILLPDDNEKAKPKRP